MPKSYSKESWRIGRVVDTGEQNELVGVRSSSPIMSRSQITKLACWAPFTLILVPYLKHSSHPLDSFCSTLGHSYALLFHLLDNLSQLGWLAICLSVSFCTVYIPTPLLHDPCYPLLFWGYITLLWGQL